MQDVDAATQAQSLQGVLSRLNAARADYEDAFTRYKSAESAARKAKKESEAKGYDFRRVAQELWDFGIPVDELQLPWPPKKFTLKARVRHVWRSLQEAITGNLP